MTLTPKDRVRVQLSNGYEATGTLVRKYKNGRVGIREDSGRYHVRSVDSRLCNVTKLAAG